MTAPQRPSDFGGITLKCSIAVSSLLKSERGGGLQCLLHCPVLNRKNRRRKLFIIQLLKGVKCLERRKGSE